jgi:hypothetical protein
MDFLERWLGFSPDGGSGAIEVLLIIVLFSAIATIARRRTQKQRRRI